jgi:hypothetical protein
MRDGFSGILRLSCEEQPGNEKKLKECVCVLKLWFGVLFAPFGVGKGMPLEDVEDFNLLLNNTEEWWLKEKQKEEMPTTFRLPYLYNEAGELCEMGSREYFDFRVRQNKGMTQEEVRDFHEFFGTTPAPLVSQVIFTYPLIFCVFY